MPDEPAFDHSDAIQRFQRAKTYWSEIREEAIRDLRYRTGEQWDPSVKADRENDERFPKPALTFNELHTMVQNTTNKARKDRPQPKVAPGDGGNPDTADFIEGRLRHIFYASQADVAFDHGVEYGASCGFGVYRIIKAEVGRRKKHYEPRVKRILDPLKALYVDPGVEEPDFSDAKWWFVVGRERREGFKEKFGVDPAPFDKADADWGGTEDEVTVAEYWHIEGEDDEREVWCSLMDGAQFLEHTPWEGYWIPLIPVLGQELIVEGKRQLISLIRYSRDPQKLLNAYGSSMAAAIGSADGGHYLGQAGIFKHRNWTDGKKHLWYEYEPRNSMGDPSQPPAWIDPEPAIQAMTQGWLQMQDQVKRSVGYQDNVLQMAKTPLSGIAVNRREDQQETINFHFEDNLIRSQWHCARVLIDLEMEWNDIPRVVQTRSEDGKVTSKPIAIRNGSDLKLVEGYAPEDHIVYDPEAEYDSVVEPGKNYASKIEAETDALIQVMQANPALMPLYLDRFFALMGFGDLEARAKLALPPQVQQAEQAKQQGIPPQAQQVIAQGQMRVQQLMQLVQKLLQEREGKVVQGQTELNKQKLKTLGDLMIQMDKHRHEHGLAMNDARFAAVEKMLEMFHESELSPDPNAPQPGQGPAPGVAA